MIRTRDSSTWQPTLQAQRPDDLLAPQTQVVPDRDAYLGEGLRDVGRRISADQVELFVTGDVALSLEQEFQQLAPDFIALHDVGVSASLRQLSSLASAAGTRVQRLSVRRRGHGVALAVLQFVEVALADGTMVRVYSTDINADSQARARTALMLLAHSRLGVLMLGELPPHALTTQLKPVRDALLKGDWSNRDLLMVPLGSGTAMAAQGAQLAAGTPVAVNVTPRANTPLQVWNFIGGAWNRLHLAPGGRGELPTEIGRPPPEPAPPAGLPRTALELEPYDQAPKAAPLPRTQQPASESLLSRRALVQADPPPPALHTQPGALPMPVPGAVRWQGYAERCAAIPGALSACVFDMHSSEPMAHAGMTPAAERLAQQGSVLLVAMNNASRALGLGSAQAQALVSTAAHHLLLRPVPGHPGVAVHLVVQAAGCSASAAQAQLERIEPPR